MLDNFIFENHLGQRFTGLEYGVYINESDLRDYEWSYDTINSRISRFYRGITKRKLPLIVHGSTAEAATYAKNKLHELAEVDIAARQAGRVYVGDYYTRGYLTGSAKSEYHLVDRYCKLDFSLTSDDPAWYKEQRHVFVQGGETDVGTDGGTDYPYDYKYDYALSLTGRSILCDAVGSSAFRLLIYGEASNPTIIIGGHAYAVNGTIGAGESLLIDSLAKTITLTTSTGASVNWFDRRARENYIFEPIPAGKVTVSWPGTFGFELTTIEKRSEPRWT